MPICAAASQHGAAERAQADAGHAECRAGRDVPAGAERGHRGPQSPPRPATPGARASVLRRPVGGADRQDDGNQPRGGQEPHRAGHGRPPHRPGADRLCLWSRSLGRQIAEPRRARREGPRRVGPSGSGPAGQAQRVGPGGSGPAGRARRVGPGGSGPACQAQRVRPARQASASRIMGSTCVPSNSMDRSTWACGMCPRSIWMICRLCPSTRWKSTSRRAISAGEPANTIPPGP